MKNHFRLFDYCLDIIDEDKPYYIRGLKEYNNDKMFLVDTIRNEQDKYEKTVNELLDFNI